ncbi:hypothetical protein GCM10027446_08150 [Angustibacter peucedani]
MAVAAALVLPLGVAGVAFAASRPATSSVRAALPTAPEGWTTQQQGALSFALPPGFEPVPSGAGLTVAAAQWTKTDDRKLAVAPAAVVYLENGAVGPLAVRGALVTRSRSAELGVQPSRPLRTVPVPGSAGAAAVEWTFGQRLRAVKKPLASRQLEVVVQLDGREQYGLSLGGPAAFLTDQVVQDFLASITVSEPSS